MELVKSYNGQSVRQLNKQEQIEQVSQVLIEIAGGNFNLQAPVSDEFDEIDAIASGVNMLSEELRDTVISRNYLDSVLRSIVDILFIFDDQFNIQQTTPKACELLGFEEEFLIGKPVNVLFDGRQKRVIKRIKDYMLEKGRVQNMETTFKTYDKKRLPVTLSLFSLKNNRNVVNGYLLIAEDVQEKLVTSNMLKKRNEELKTLVYRTSHDLRGPLASMLGLFNVLEKEKQDLPTLQYYLKHLKVSVERLNKTLLGLLEVGFVDQSVLAVRPFYVYNTIQEVLNSLDNYPGREEVEIEVSVDKKLLLTSSEKLISSVIQNLVENSIKYRKPGELQASTIHLSMRLDKVGICLVVKDNGQGMEKSVLKKAFDMFYRGNETSSGSGLGLFIVKSNVEKLSGAIRIKSRYGEGTEVKVHLPIRNKLDFLED